jgi:hypothetical protein
MKPAQFENVQIGSLCLKVNVLKAIRPETLVHFVS